MINKIKVEKPKPSSMEEWASDYRILGDAYVAGIHMGCRKMLEMAREKQFSTISHHYEEGICKVLVGGEINGPFVLLSDLEKWVGEKEGE